MELNVNMGDRILYTTPRFPCDVKSGIVLDIERIMPQRTGKPFNMFVVTNCESEENRRVHGSNVVSVEHLRPDVDGMASI